MLKNVKKNNLVEEVKETQIENANLISPCFLPDPAFYCTNVSKDGVIRITNPNNETFYSMFNAITSHESALFNVNCAEQSARINSNPVIRETRDNMLSTVFNNRVSFLMNNAYNNFLAMCTGITLNIIFESDSSLSENDKVNLEFTINAISIDDNRRTFYPGHTIYLRDIIGEKNIFLNNMGEFCHEIFSQIATRNASDAYNFWYTNWFNKLINYGISDFMLGRYTDAIVIYRDMINSIYNIAYQEAITIYNDASYPALGGFNKEDDWY